VTAVARNTIVTVAIELRDAQDELIDAGESPVVYLHGGYGGLIDALENALEGRLPGESISLELEPEQAFGEYDAELLRIEDRSRYGGGLEVGMEVEDDFDEGDSLHYIVTDLTPEKVVLDANHPLAGIALRFDCRVVSVRAATPEELERQGPL
jgi:FKBP-type peptidyl-prolyl cis-trans isomerase SlyD